MKNSCGCGAVNEGRPPLVLWCSVINTHQFHAHLTSRRRWKRNTNELGQPIKVRPSTPRSPKMRTPTSGEPGYRGQRNAGTQSPVACNEDQPRYNMPQFEYTLPGAIRCVRTPPSFSEVRDQKPRRRVRGKDPPPFGSIVREFQIFEKMCADA